MRAAKIIIYLKLHNQTVPQNIRVAWTWCNFGGSRPCLIFQCETGGAAVQGTERLLLPILLRKPGLREPAQEQEGTVIFKSV